LNSTGASLLAFACTFGASLIGMTIRSRLPSHHMESNAADTPKLVLGLVATLTALVLGLLVSSGYSSYQLRQAELQVLSVHLFQIDRDLARFGPEANPQRDKLRQLLATNIARVWPIDGPIDGQVLARGTSGQRDLEALYGSVEGLPATTDRQRLSQTKALELLDDTRASWRLLAAQSESKLPRPVLVILLTWLVVLFFGFGLFARPNTTVFVALIVGALSVAGAVFLIIEMNQPYSGWMQISAAPLRATLSEMGT
jgi:Protein of unknown function (DUF4239)